jgi:hypothetical protein
MSEGEGDRYAMALGITRTAQLTNQSRRRERSPSCSTSRSRLRITISSTCTPRSAYRAEPRPSCGRCATTSFGRTGAFRAPRVDASPMYELATEARSSDGERIFRRNLCGSSARDVVVTMNDPRVPVSPGRKRRSSALPRSAGAGPPRRRRRRGRIVRPGVLGVAPNHLATDLAP